MGMLKNLFLLILGLCVLYLIWFYRRTGIIAKKNQVKENVNDNPLVRKSWDTEDFKEWQTGDIVLFDLKKAKIATLARLLEPIVIFASQCEYPHAGVFIWDDKIKDMPCVLFFGRNHRKNRGFVFENDPQIDRHWAIIPFYVVQRQAANGIVRIPCNKKITALDIYNGMQKFGANKKFYLNIYKDYMLPFRKREEDFVIDNTRNDGGGDNLQFVCSGAVIFLLSHMQLIDLQTLLNIHNNNVKSLTTCIPCKLAQTSFVKNTLTQYSNPYFVAK